ncbi:MAG: hypothetical protein RL215_1942 [Planctomycetota bacterium]
MAWLRDWSVDMQALQGNAGWLHFEELCGTNCRPCGRGCRSTAVAGSMHLLLAERREPSGEG